MKNIKLNNEIELDLPKLIEGGMVILANSGGGKSYAIRRIAEQAVDNVQVIILDPEGEFASLREKYDFILAGKDADVPVEVRSAALLATKLLELDKSAVIDLYELHPQERQRFVKNFCDALVNCPKSLYHPVIIILDEAHEYVPEGKPSEATWAVESLASKGRKRGQRLVLASQRISKLSKNAAAECNNKLIGRASQDIDMKRAGDELGFSKEKLTQLRQLKPGEFFAFGPAISDEVIKVKIGEVKTSHAKVGYKGIKKTPPPSSVIKKVLGELKDLPEEAEKEAKTIKELKEENANLKRQNTNLLRHPFQKDLTPEEIEKIAMPYVKILVDKTKKMNIEIMTLSQTLSKIKNMIPDTLPMIDLEGIFIVRPIPKNIFKTDVSKASFPIDAEVRKNGRIDSFDSPYKDMGKCEKAIYSFLAEDQSVIWSKTQVAVAVGYSQNSGGFNNAISKLAASQLISRGNGTLYIPEDALIEQDLIIEIDKSLSKWSAKLGACSRKIWDAMLAHHPDELWTKEQLGSETGYSPTSGGFNNSISELSALGLIERVPGGVRINPELFKIQ
jgi:hypothetical protein